ncbi:MAG: DNA-directed DNA polymerase II small subunit [Candidatus Hermodarchaeota archaeon]|nr:DNA-directed DNA polymerase II small subunit [Candidatus Hermodarchaeota archaeon]
MHPDDKVQTAITKLIKAGFQISPEALELLKEQPRPVQFVNTFLAAERVHPAETPLLEPTHFTEFQDEEPPLPLEDSVATRPETPHLTSSKAIAEGVKADIQILKDPTPEIRGKGTLEDFHQTFQDRYNRLRQIITQRVDGKGVTEIRQVKKEAKNASAKPQTVKVVGIVNTKYLTKSGNIAIELEDPTGIISCVIQQRDPQLLNKAQIVLLDQVICVEGALVSDEMIIAKDLFLPDVPTNRRNNRAKENISALLLSDIHFGSKHFLDDVFQRVIEWLKGEECDKEQIELAGTVKYIVINGDLVDGIGVYPNQREEITIHDLNNQFQGLNRLLQEIPTQINLIIAPGNHDGVRTAIPRPAIANHFFDSLRDSGLQVTSLGCPSQISLHGVQLLIYHGDSLIDIMGALSKPDVEAGFAAMRAMLQGRHLAPIYGKGTTIVAEPRDWLVIDEVPDILHCGHIHVTTLSSYRKTLIINSGTFQSQTEYQRLVGIEPTPGIVPLVDLQTLNVKQLYFI